MKRGAGPVTPMFPLGSVLLPHMLLPLHIFEPRYRILMEELLGDLTRPEDQNDPDGAPRFGVTLIERGSEVGGEDARADVGTLAGVIGAQRTDDGRWAAAIVGEERCRVLEWLEDDPYPRARVEPWPDDPDDQPSSTAWTGVRERHTTLAALLAEAGVEGPEADIDWTALFDLVVWQVALASPLGSLDRYRLLRAPGLGERTSLLLEQLEEQIELLRGRSS